MIIFDILSIKVCLVGWILGRIKKRGEKMGRENIFCECLAEGRAGKKTDGAWMFSHWAKQNVFSPYWGKN